MPGRLAGRIALVTGASSGLGRAICLAYAAEGARVCCVDMYESPRNRTNAETGKADHYSNRIEGETTVQEIRRLHGDSIAHFVEADVTKADDVQSAVLECVEMFGRLDIMANNAGISVEASHPRPLGVHETSERDWDKTMEINAKGVFLGCKYADLLKEVAQTQQVDLAAKQRFKVVVINEADHLTRDAQAALRRTMEKYSPNLRLILLANSTSNITAPIRSRCLLVRVAAPTEDEIASVLARVGKKEGYKSCEPLERRIAKESGRNLRRALLMFESVHAQNDNVTDKTPIPPPDWEALIEVIAKEMIEERSPARILQVRAKLYDLLTHCIPATTVLKTLTFKLMPKIDDSIKADIVKWSAFYEHRIRTGSKVIFHLEAFVAKFMRIYEGNLMGMDMDFDD
ncbi:Replication factor C (RF-C) subunit [Friedmanniomyces endolithicus]|nr:Replication factor C (RF-C) subunit [Friedmanniomyces endolithicus]